MSYVAFVGTWLWMRLRRVLSPFRNGFELHCGLEISDLLLHMYACNWPIDIHLDGFVLLPSAYIVVISKVLGCFNGKLCNEFNGVKLDSTSWHSLSPSLTSGFYKPA